MIRVRRADEPPGLAAVRSAELKRVRDALARGTDLEEIAIGQEYAGPGHPPAYKVLMWSTQHNKCAWCEQRGVVRNRDVEHYRPKKRALGRDGEVRSGWWWLAWTRDNLFFSCDTCNRYEKRIRFPLADESRRLLPEQQPPGPEEPLLLDPTSVEVDPMDHIVFRQVRPDDPGDWQPFARHGSVWGEQTIEILGLRSDELRTLYRRRFENDLHHLIREKHQQLELARQDGSEEALDRFRSAWAVHVRAQLSPHQVFAGLTYDIYDHYFPGAIREELDLILPRPGDPSP